MRVKAGMVCMAARCVRCDSRKRVWELQGQRSDGTNVSAELCAVCWGEVVEGYGFEVTARQKRRLFEVVDEDEID